MLLSLLVLVTDGCGRATPYVAGLEQEHTRICSHQKLTAESQHIEKESELCLFLQATKHKRLPWTTARAKV